MRITIAQLNPIVGDIRGNLKRAEIELSKANGNSDLIVFSELFLTGYPPRDLLERADFIEQIKAAIEELLCISRKYPQLGFVMGTPTPTGRNKGVGLYNTAILVQNGKILGSQHKYLLPTYDVFDESRYFEPATETNVIPFKNCMLGISICEDMWNVPNLWSKRLYSLDPIRLLAEKGATVILNLSASPFYAGKEKIRYGLISNHAKKHKIPFIFINQVGGNDELVFDGRSMYLNSEGKILELFQAFKEEVKTINIDHGGKELKYTPQDETESVYNALVLGIKDYMRKCGFPRAIIALSGGIDSAVTCCLAKEAVGEDDVLALYMPSSFSSEESKEYALSLASNLGIKFRIIPIAPIYFSYVKSLRKGLNIEDEEVDITLENVQARIRGNILMAFSNKYGYLVLSTGNKSELAVGYCTLYGDMTGGLAVISDVPKTMVYDLAVYINRDKKIIPQEIIERPPTAELRPNQKDQDTLPPYKILDEILYYYIEEGYSMGDIIKLNYDSDVVNWVIKAVSKNEYKRRQAPPGLKVTTKAFGSGRRMPIAAKIIQ
jgi:NAD+ synthase (glutamine-hydrolysing)